VRGSLDLTGASPADLLERLEAAPPEVVLIDGNLPGGDLARGTLLGVVLLFWARVLGRAGPVQDAPSEWAWVAIRNVHAAWWGTLAAVSWMLRAVP